MNRISLRESVGNNSNQPYLANDLIEVGFTFLSRSYYYFLVKSKQSFVPHISTNITYFDFIFLLKSLMTRA